MPNIDHSEREHAMHNASSANIWMDCALYYQYKVQAEATGEQYDTAGEAARRGTLCHEVAEDAMGRWLNGDYLGDITKCVAVADAELKTNLTQEEFELVEVALSGAITLIDDKDMSVALEIPVQLSHEKESSGAIDLLAFRTVEVAPGQEILDHILVLDYKFGEGAVSPNSHQLKIYGANSLVHLKELGLSIGPNTRVKLAIMQPRLHVDPIVRVFDAYDLVKYQAYVEGVVFAQVEGGDRRGAGSLKTCENFCPFKSRCFHRPNLVQHMMVDLTSTADRKTPDSTIEEIVRSASAFKKVIEECKDLVKDDEVRFPNWTRVTVNNAESWSPIIHPDDIIKRLGNAKDLFTLSTPKKVRDANPKIAKKIDALVADRGTHIRLYEGAPKGAPKAEPQRRAVPKDGARPAKKATKKAAAKRSAKKAARKKA